jgi:Sec-independent protein translocase protein TatA
MGSALGKGIREFKNSIKEVKDSVDAGGTTEAPPSRRIDSPVTSDGEPRKLSQ